MKKVRVGKIILITALIASAVSVTGLLLSNNNNAVETQATYTPSDPATYYQSIGSNATGTNLLYSLQSLNSSKRRTTVGYGNMGTSPSGQFKYTDYDPTTVQYDSNNQPYGTKLIGFYSGTSTTSGLNREHVWPNSHGGGTVEDDIHMPRPTLTAENGSRGNSFYVEGMKHSSNGWDPAMESWGDETYRGDSARIIFYCVVANSSLSLLDDTYHATSNSNPDYKMGKLSDLLKWNIQYPVTDREQRRNLGAEYLQGNRNPFIDHPEYACRIWGSTNSETQSICSAAPETLTDISLNTTSTTATPGSTLQLTVTPTPSTASASVTWGTSNNAVATVNNNGLVTIKSTAQIGGYALITATSTVDASIKAYCNITVVEEDPFEPEEPEDPIEGDQFTKVTNISQLSTGDEVVLATDVPTNENAIGVTGWNGTNDATVSTTLSQFVKYQVTVSGSNYTLKDTTANKYFAQPTDNHFKYSTTAGSCVANENGYLECNSRYLAVNGTYYRCYALSKSYPPFYVYKVNDSSEEPGDSISLNKSSLSLEPGDSETLTYEATGSVTWYSDNTSVATVSNGTITAVGQGSATIIATCGEATATCIVTVTSPETPHLGTEDSPFTPEEAIAKIDEIDKGTTSEKYCVRGYIKSFVETYTTQYNNISVMITSEPNGSGSQFEIFRVTITQDLAQILKVGCLITCEANLTYYTKNSVYETTSGGQLKRVDETFSSCFLNNLTCDVTGATAPTLVEDWETLETAYDSIAEMYKYNLQTASYTVSGTGADTVVTATGTTKQLVAEAMYKYDIITTKYSQYTNFITSRTPLVAINGYVQPINQNSTATIIVISFIGLTTFGGLFFLKRRKE